MDGRPSTSPRPRRALIRQLFPAVFLAILTVLIASRINNPLIIPTPVPHPLLSEVIPDVELDTRTFERAVQSLAAKTRARLVIDPSLSEAIAKGVEGAGGAGADQISVLQHFKNIELGSLVARLLDQWGDRLPVNYRIEGRTITFYAPNAASTETRIYNVRDLTADWRAWRALAKSWEPPKPPPPPPTPGGGGGGLFGGGGRFNRQYDRDDDEFAFRLAMQIPVKIDSEDFKIIAIWSGCIIIEATPELQDWFKHLLATWAQRQSPIHGATP